MRKYCYDEANDKMLAFTMWTCKIFHPPQRDWWVTVREEESRKMRSSCRTARRIAFIKEVTK